MAVENNSNCIFTVAGACHAWRDVFNADVGGGSNLTCVFARNANMLITTKIQILVC